MKSIIRTVNDENWEIFLNSNNTAIFAQISEEEPGIYVDGNRVTDNNISNSIHAIFMQNTDVFGKQIPFIDFIESIIKVYTTPGFTKQVIGLPKVTKQLFSANQNAKLLATFLDNETDIYFLGFGIRIHPEIMKNANGFNLQPILLYDSLKFVGDDPNGSVINNTALLLCSGKKISVVLGVDYEKAVSV